MEIGDEILIVEGPTIRLLGRIAAKTVNPALSRELWKNLHGETTEGWDLIFFIGNPREINLPFADFRRLIGYQDTFNLRGFTAVANDRLKGFYARYDDLYSILIAFRDNREIVTLREPARVEEEPQPLDRYLDEDADDTLPEIPDPASDHLRMQYTLLRMGRQAGEKVWAPRSDQGRIRSKFEFEDFEETFAAGLNAQVKYLENIDVVWKEDFRIDAAFEVENSTSIYSGLLRFADLAMVAPNSVYPLFIVAPSERRNRVREQLIRPTFRHLQLPEKVRFLSYETVQEIEDFVGLTASGISVELLSGKAEKLTARDNVLNSHSD